MPWRMAPAWPAMPPPYDVDPDVELGLRVGGLEGHDGDGLQHAPAEVVVELLAVDDHAADAGGEDDARDAGLAPAGAACR